MQTIQQIVDAVVVVVKPEPVEEVEEATKEIEGMTDAEGVEPVTEEAVLVSTDETPAAEVEAEELSLDEIFTLKPEILVAGATVEEDESASSPAAAAKKKKKKKYVEVTYDPDRDVTTARKVHKRDDGTIVWEE